MTMAGLEAERTRLDQKLWDGVRTRMHLVRYALFAGAAMLINLLSQNAVRLILGKLPIAIYAAILVGTASGLIFKFIADKYWVFEDGEATLTGNSKKFVIYAFFGLATTAIFWAVELLFHYLFGSVFMTNVGAVLGLCIGYVVKYNLDKRVTFRPR
jgi:putative flippase GtrA